HGKGLNKETMTPWRSINYKFSRVPSKCPISYPESSSHEAYFVQPRVTSAISASFSSEYLFSSSANNWENKINPPIVIPTNNILTTQRNAGIVIFLESLNNNHSESAGTNPRII